MPDIPLPENLSTELGHIERRLRALEGARRAQNTEVPWAAQYIETEEGTTSTTNANLATYGPEVTVNVTNTGRVLITISSWVSVGNNNLGIVAMFIDGSPPPGWTYAPIVIDNDGTGGVISGSYSTTRIYQNAILTPGPHTFTLKYRSDNGSLVNFSDRSLIVQPF